MWQPDYGDFDSRGLDLSVESNDIAKVFAAHNLPALENAIGPLYEIRPSQTYGIPQRVWLPIPEKVDQDEVRVYYYLKGGAGMGWYPAEDAAEWLISDSYLYLDLDGRRYLGFLVRHSGAVQLTTSAERTD